MFGRSKPRTISSGSRMFSRSTISSRTGGAAVAVRARTVAIRAALPRRRSAGSPAGTRGPTRRCSAPRRPRAAKCWLPRGARPSPRAQAAPPPGTGTRAPPRRAPRGAPRVSSRTPTRRPRPPRRAVPPRCVLDLVALERDERRDHERRPVDHPPGDLVDRSRGHHDERVAAGRQGAHRLLLARPQLLEAELLPGHLTKVLRFTHMLTWS